MKGKMTTGTDEEDNGQLNPTILSFQQRDEQHPYNQKLVKPDNLGENGIVASRKMTDLVGCAIFVLVIVATVILSSIVISKGKMDYLTHGSDFRGASCGTEDLEGRQFVYWPLPSQDTDVRLCVSSCPTNYNDYACYYTHDGKSTFVDVDVDPSIEDRDNKYCNLTMETEAMAFYCIPEEPFSRHEVRDAIEATSESLRLAGRDIYISRWVILGAIALSVACALCLSFLFQCHRKTIILAIALSALGTLVALAVMAYAFYSEYQRNVDLYCLEDIDLYKCAGRYAYGYRRLSYATIILGVVYLFTLLFFRKKFPKVVPAFMVCSKTLRRISNLWLYPFLGLLCMLLVTYGIVYAGAYSLTVGERKIEEASGIPGGRVAYISYDDIKYSVYFFVFVYIWFMFVIQASHYYMMASSTVMWYFDKDKQVRKTPTFSTSVFNLVVYHLGSVVSAVTLIPILLPFKLVIGTLENRLGKAHYRSKVTGFFINSLSTCFYVYEVYIKYISINGIVQVAFSGKNYRKASATSYYLLRRNYNKIKSLTFFMYYINTLSRFSVSVLAFVITFYTTKNAHDGDEEYSGVVNPAIPAIFAFFIAFITTAPFLDIYDAVFDSIAQCLIMDEEMNNYDRVAQASIEHFDDIIALDFDDDEIQTFEPGQTASMFDNITPTMGSQKQKNAMAMKRAGNHKQRKFDGSEIAETEQGLNE